MKTLKELKQQKKIKVVKTIKGKSQKQQINEIINNLQPEQFTGKYKKENYFTTTIKNNQVIFYCNTLYCFLILPKIAINEIKKEVAKNNGLNIKDIKVERIEKLNRYLITIKDYELTKTIKAEADKVEEGMIEFRSNDYIFINKEGRKSYGEPLKANNLIKDSAGNIKGFYITTFSNQRIEYIFC